MKEFYTIVKRYVLFSFLLSGLLANTAFSQICGGIQENFNNTGGTTAGFFGDFSYDAAGQRLIRRNVIATAVYSITTPTYVLPQGSTSLGFGFILDGTEQVSRVEVVVAYISTLTNQMTTFLLSQFVPNYGASTQATICQAVDLSALPGFPPGGQYRFRIELTSSTGTGLAAQTITFDNFRTNGTLSQTPLPVTFIGFSARKTTGGTELTWKVAGEENVKSYEVERSTDGRNFTSVANVLSSKSDNYIYVDPTAASTVYYRIKNVDNDGKYKYSSIARITNGKLEIVLKAFPQPVLGNLTVQHPVIKSNGLITVSTADGRIVKSIRPSVGTMQTGVDMSSFQKGLYMVRFDDGEGNAETMKIVKQ